MNTLDPTSDPAWRLFQQRFGALRRSRQLETLLTVAVIVLLFVVSAVWTDFSPAKVAAGLPRIEVKFLIDANGILHVSAREQRSGKEAEIEVKPTYGLTDEQVEEMILSSFDNAEEDIRARQVIEAKNEAQTILSAVEKGRKNEAWQKLTSDEIALIEQGEDELKGMQLAVEHINEGNDLLKQIAPKVTTGVLGKKVELLVADSAAKPNDAVQAEQTFINDKKIIAMTGATSSAVAVALNKFAQREKILYLVAISGSGNSPNVLRAVEYANEHGMKTIGITGFSGGKLKDMVTEQVHVPLNDMCTAESIHTIIFHYVILELQKRMVAAGE